MSENGVKWWKSKPGRVREIESSYQVNVDSLMSNINFIRVLNWCIVSETIYILYELIPLASTLVISIYLFIYFSATVDQLPFINGHCFLSWLSLIGVYSILCTCKMCVCVCVSIHLFIQFVCFGCIFRFIFVYIFARSIEQLFYAKLNVTAGIPNHIINASSKMRTVWKFVYAFDSHLTFIGSYEIMAGSFYHLAYREWMNEYCFTLISIDLSFPVYRANAFFFFGGCFMHWNMLTCNTHSLCTKIW